MVETCSKGMKKEEKKQNVAIEIGTQKKRRTLIDHILNVKNVSENH